MSTDSRNFRTALAGLAVFWAVFAFGVVKLAEAAPARVRVPRVTGMQAAQAQRTLRAHHLRVGKITYTAGQKPGVLATSPRAGRRVARRTRVNLRIAKPAPARPAVVPPPRAPPPTPTPPAPPASVPFKAPIVGYADSAMSVNDMDETTVARAHDATVLKVGIPWNRPENADEARELGTPPPPTDAPIISRQTIADAERNGLRVFLQLDFPAPDVLGEQQTISMLKGRIAMYASLNPWAVSIGNETGLRNMTGTDYRRVWDAVEPTLKTLMPNAMLVFGEDDPWGIDHLYQEWGASAPAGARAVALHFYDTTILGLSKMPEVAAWARARGVQLWDSESAPGTVPAFDWLRVETVAQYDAYLDRQLRASDNTVAVVVKYHWPAIGGLN